MGESLRETSVERANTSTTRILLKSARGTSNGSTKEIMTVVSALVAELFRMELIVEAVGDSVEFRMDKEKVNS